MWALQADLFADNAVRVSESSAEVEHQAEIVGRDSYLCTLLPNPTQKAAKPRTQRT